MGGAARRAVLVVGAPSAVREPLRVVMRGQAGIAHCHAYVLAGQCVRLAVGNIPRSHSRARSHRPLLRSAHALAPSWIPK